jgi:UDP:flavonoid glycosyltransferase YjiC (YdhE family)
LITVGGDIDPAALGPVPGHVHVEPFVDQDRVLPHVSLVVSHAGSGTVLGSLAHGLPMVLIPMGADQPWNGDRCLALGVGRVLDPVIASSDDIAAAVRDALGDPAMRAAAARLRQAMAALPPPADAVRAVEALAAG